jgi:hypothetical protein
MAHTGDKYSYQHYKAQKLLNDTGEIARQWTLHPGYIKAKWLSDSARSKDAWIFDPVDKRWYTPDEFITDTRSLPDASPVFERIQIRYPMDGIKAGLKQLNELQKKLEDFTNKVADYYKK